jgi:hypothetical protein
MKIDGERKGDQERIRKGDGEVKNPRRQFRCLVGSVAQAQQRRICQEGRENSGDGTQKFKKTREER